MTPEAVAQSLDKLPQMMTLGSAYVGAEDYNSENEKKKKKSRGVE